MKLISQNLENVLTVDYFGVVFTVSEDYNYIATDSDGKVWLYVFEPNKEVTGWNVGEYERDFALLGVVDLEGLDWRTTRRRLSDIEIPKD